MKQVQTQFRENDRTHVLMITNHGVHEWQVVPGMPDTGGQNVYVNQFTEALVQQGYRVTIVNRGGYPHPVSGEMQTGVRYHESGYARIMYIEDGLHEFVRKEDMDEQLPALANDLTSKLAMEDDTYDIIISHYWDAGKLGMILNQRNPKRVPHAWIPHSLGALKKRNMDPSTWANLRINERIENERELLKHVDAGVATSTAIRETFRDEYGFEAKYFLPPCIDVDRIHPRGEEEHTEEYAQIWDFLDKLSPHNAETLRRRKLITEISRTDKTKRKDVLIKAFAEVRERVPDAVLAVSIDTHAEELHQQLMDLIDQLGVREDVIVLGSVWDQLPMLYNVTTVYCTPSVMEGFGMSAQEAAATRKPVVSSDKVPFVEEYLLGDEVEEVTIPVDGMEATLRVGVGGVVVPADCVPGFAEALVRLLQDEQKREEMGNRAYDITIPYFTWESRTKELLGDLGISAKRGVKVG